MRAHSSLNFIFPGIRKKKLVSNSFFREYKLYFEKPQTLLRQFIIQSAVCYSYTHINKANVITIALNPKEHYERFDDHADNKKHKGLKKSTRGMDFDSYSSRLPDLNEFSKEFFKKPKKIQQKRFQIIIKSVQVKAVSFLQNCFLQKS